MGRPKALLELGGRTLVEWLVGRLGPAFTEVLVSADDDRFAPAGTRLVRDLHVGAGPLAGIEAGLAAAREDRIFVVACDLPAVTPGVAEALLQALEGHDAAVPRIEGAAEPACAAWSRAAAPAVADALGRGERRVQAVLEDLDVAWVEGLDHAAFRNLNTPDDYRAFLDALR